MHSANISLEKFYWYATNNDIFEANQLCFSSADKIFSGQFIVSKRSLLHPHFLPSIFWLRYIDLERTFSRVRPCPIY